MRALGGLHRFMDWPRSILTDSGGFQVFSLNSLRKISEDGVLFQSHLDGRLICSRLSRRWMFSWRLGSDICMVLDECLGYPATRDAAKVSMDRTIRWARRGIDHWRERSRAVESQHALFPIVQGGMYLDLRAECARELVELDAPGYAIGGLSVGEPRELSQEVTEATTPLLPQEKAALCHGSRHA